MSVWLSRRLVSLLLRRITVGSLIVVEGDERRVYGSGAPAATVRIDSPRTWRMLLRGSRGMAEAFAQGLWDSPDLVALIRLAARNAGGLDRLRSRLAPVRWPLQRAGALVRRSTKRRRRRDIAAHYDLGNELFARMLDPTMSYSCALFEREGMTLEQAQVAKLERVCEQLDLGPGDRVLEIGTGWGAFALHAAATRGCHVTTTTISREQHDYAVEQVRRAGLSDRVTVLMEDYRELRGRYDKLVSIEMIEAVGWRHFGTFFAKCSELLASDGAMLLQAITIDDRAYEVEKASKSFINTYIFPGGCLPSLEVIARNVGPANRPAGGRARGPDAALRRDAAALARELHGPCRRARGARLRRALPSALDALPRLLRSRLRRAADLRRPAAADQAPVADCLTHVPDRP